MSLRIIGAPMTLGEKAIRIVGFAVVVVAGWYGTRKYFGDEFAQAYIVATLVGSLASLSFGLWRLAMKERR